MTRERERDRWRDKREKKRKREEESLLLLLLLLCSAMTTHEIKLHNLNWVLLREDLDLEISFNSWFLLIRYGEV